MHKGGTFGKFSTSIGLAMYDRLAGVKKSERKKMLSKQETLNKEPLVKRDGLKGGGYYVEYRTDDARLTKGSLFKVSCLDNIFLRSDFLTPARRSYIASPIEVENLPNVPPLCIGKSIHSGVVTCGPFS
ncbi:Aerobic glycerol-3-phosphate dehydrogenase [Mycobacteroides abscessus subsp. massiliense]|nr:Aerobic glycerol-3-phosphate dehydrogenase [Mycobacteroides abscessus subsp. massiliense]